MSLCQVWKFPFGAIDASLRCQMPITAVCNGGALVWHIFEDKRFRA